MSQLKFHNVHFELPIYKGRNRELFLPLSLKNSFNGNASLLKKEIMQSKQFEILFGIALRAVKRNGRCVCRTQDNCETRTHGGFLPI